MIAEFVTAMTHGLGLNKILGTIHIYPTLAEMNKYVAGNWKKNHQPERTLRWLKKFHAWRRHEGKSVPMNAGNTSEKKLADMKNGGNN